MNESLNTKTGWTTRKKLVVALLACVGIFVGVVFPALFWQLHVAAKSLHSFAEALIAKDYTRAYSLTTGDFDAVTDFATFVKVHQGLTTRMGDLKSIEVDHIEIKERTDAWRGNVDADLVFARGDLDFTFRLKKENGVWKVESYSEQ